MSIERHILNGATMGTRWSAIVHAPHALPQTMLTARLQAAVDQVDAEMSTWKPQSDLNRLNAAPVGVWVEVPPQLFDLLRLSVEMNAITRGAFDITVGRQVARWGFGASAGKPGETVEIARQFDLPVLEFDSINRSVRKYMAVSLDLSGIAKGFGVDRLLESAREMEVEAGLFSIDGEVRALGSRPDGFGWAIGVEAPDPSMRRAESVIELSDAAIATSGTYRHCRRIGDAMVHHTIDPKTGAPSTSGIVSASVMAPTTAVADALATALLISGQPLAEELARALQLRYLLIDRNGHTITNLDEDADKAASPGTSQHAGF
ncbi:FAD:protein FMN transferase [Allorhizobium sp. BGMRC 0089]|uniref:FAD:protein FMN transferase n=1 Tax=Allorhizobium sonneratiae TaxID=2934936 RepID=UPI00203465EF|nr:FAD:protein FMN transferase [Allorhizobium sonneratiae]MCM2293875.1 FAD:protein FMN transferase [Allorhizobium sonneratiae]